MINDFNWKIQDEASNEACKIIHKLNTCEEDNDLINRLMKWFRWGYVIGYAKAKGLEIAHILDHGHFEIEIRDKPIKQDNTEG